MTEVPESQVHQKQNEDSALGANSERESWARRRFNDYLFLFLLAGGIVLLDQVTKSLVRSNIPFGGVWAPWEWLLPYARIVHWQNTGAAFGLFQDFGLVFTILAILVSAAIIYYYPQVPREDWTLRLAMGLQLGGALGNLISRLTIGEVTDFLSIWTFPVFNVADLSITLGVVVLLYGMFHKERLEKRAALEENSPKDQSLESPVQVKAELHPEEPSPAQDPDGPVQVDLGAEE